VDSVDEAVDNLSVGNLAVDVEMPYPNLKFGINVRKGGAAAAERKKGGKINKSKKIPLLTSGPGKRNYQKELICRPTNFFQLFNFFNF
jgi:hypothetical protein